MQGIKLLRSADHYSQSLLTFLIVRVPLKSEFDLFIIYFDLFYCAFMYANTDDKSGVWS